MPDLVHTIGDPRGQVQRAAAAACNRVVGAAPEITVAAGLADCPAGYEQARAGNQAVVDRLFQAPVSARGVADGRKSPVQQAIEYDARLRRDQRNRNLFQLHQVHVGQERVYVQVDEPRHDCPARQVVFRGAARVDPGPGYRGHGAIFHEYVDLGRWLRTRTVYQDAVAEDDRCCRAVGHSACTLPCLPTV